MYTFHFKKKMSSEENDFILMPLLVCEGCNKTDGIYFEDEPNELNIKRILLHLREKCIDKANRLKYCTCNGQDHKKLMDEVLIRQIEE